MIHTITPMLEYRVAFVLCSGMSGPRVFLYALEWRMYRKPSSTFTIVLAANLGFAAVLFAAFEDNSTCYPTNTQQHLYL